MLASITKRRNIMSNEHEYKELTQELSTWLAELRKGAPEATQGFSALAKGASNDGVLSKKVKEFIALGIGIAARCDGCIGFHTKALVQLGATREEVIEVLAMNIYMGGGPAYMYAAKALKAFDEFSNAK